MSCTHDCGCTPEIRDARTDEWVQIAPESARPATLTPEQPVKAPGQDGDLVLPLKTPVEVEWTSGNRALYYVDEGGYQEIAREVGDGYPLPWEDARIVRVLTEDKPADTESAGAAYLSGPMTGLPDFNRPAFHAAAATLRAQGHVVINPAEVDLGPDATWADYMRIHLAEIARRVTQVFVLPGWESSRGAQLEVHVARALGLPVVPVLTEDKPTQEPVLPRRIKPEDVRVGMVVERRKGEAAHRDRVQQIDGELIVGTDGAWLWVPGNADGGWSLWLIGDAPEPGDPDAELVERMAKEVHDRNCADGGCRDWDGHGESTRKAWREDARVVLRNLRAQCFDVTPRAEQ